MKGELFEIPFLAHPKNYCQKVVSSRQINLYEGCPLRGSRVFSSGEVDTLDNVIVGCLESVSPPFSTVNSSSLCLDGCGTCLALLSELGLYLQLPQNKVFVF